MSCLNGCVASVYCDGPPDKYDAIVILLPWSIFMLSMNIVLQGVFIVDAGSRGVWAWVGSSTTSAAGRGALAAARGLARARRHSGPVSVTAAGHEPLEFAALFHQWRWCDKRRDVRLRAARSATTRLDAVSLASNAWLAAEVTAYYTLV